MDKLIPWERLESGIESFYPKKVERGRRPYLLNVIPRGHRMQLFYNLGDPGTVDPLSSAAFRAICFLNLLYEETCTSGVGRAMF